MVTEGWSNIKVGDVLRIRHGKDQKAVASSQGTIPILATGGQIGWATDCLYNKPSVLIGRKGTINRPQYIEQPFWTVDTLFYSEIVDSVHPKFLYYLFCLIDWQKYNEASGVPSLNAKTIENIDVIIPSDYSEQQAIAEALSDADTLIASLEKLIQKKNKISASVIKSLLDDSINAQKNAENVVELSIDEMSVVGRGRVISHREIKKAQESKYPVYSSQTSNSGIMGFLDTFDFDGEYLTWTTDGANAGTVFYRNGKFNCTNVCGTLKIKAEFDAKFVSLMLEREAPQHVSRQLGNPKLMNNIMKEIKLRLPSDLEEQRRISHQVDDIKNELKALKDRLNKAKKVKAGMMQELLTGRTRLI